MRCTMVFALLAAALLLAAPPAVSGAKAPRRALRAMAAAPQASSPPAPWAAWALWPARPQGAPPRRWLHEADPAQPAPSPPRTAPAPAPAPTDNLPDLMIPEGPASLATWFRSAVDMRPIGTPGDDVMNLSYRRLALMLDALERPPEAWQQLTDVVDAFGETVKQEVEKLSPALGGLIHLHEPEFVKVHGTSVAIHHHLAGVGATGLDVQPCLVRLGAAGAVVAPSLIDVSPTAVSLGATGASVSPALISVGPKLISVGASSGPGIANAVEFNPTLIKVAPTWEVVPAEAGVGPVLQPDLVKIDPTPGRVVVTPPVAPGAFAADRAAVQAAARARAQPAP